MCCTITKWFETGQVPLYKYLEKFHDNLCSQEAISCRQIYNGKYPGIG